MKIEKIKEIIENLDIENPSEKDIEAIEEAVTLLDTGLIRVAELNNCLLYTSPSPRDS